MWNPYSNFSYHWTSTPLNIMVNGSSLTTEASSSSGPFYVKRVRQLKGSAVSNLKRLLNAIQESSFPLLYVIIDEYDNFANQLILSHKDRLYYELMADDQFLKIFFKTLKDGAKRGRFRMSLLQEFC